MQSIILNNFGLFKNFLDIINEDQYLIICAKYYSSSMSDAHTISLADIVGLPAKVIWPIALFSNSESIFI